MKKNWVAYPYVFWMIIFTVIPLVLVFYFGLTIKTPHGVVLSFDNFKRFAEPVYIKVLIRSLILAAESTFFCLLLGYPAAMILADRRRAFVLALWCTLASVIGGMAGYAIGALLYDSVGQWLISVYGYGNKLEAFRAAYAEWGSWIILIKGLTPIPYKLVTIASGLAHFNFGMFIAASVVTRGARFFLVAALLKAFGPPIQSFVEERLTLVTSVIAVVIVGAIVALKFVGH